MASKDLRLRTPAELAARLRALRDHLRTLDSASPEAALMEDAATYIVGATDSLREHMAALRAVREALKRAAIAAEIESAGHAIAIIEAALAMEPQS